MPLASLSASRLTKLTTPINATVWPSSSLSGSCPWTSYVGTLSIAQGEAAAREAVASASWGGAAPYNPASPEVASAEAVGVQMYKLFAKSRRWNWCVRHQRVHCLTIPAIGRRQWGVAQQW